MKFVTDEDFDESDWIDFFELQSKSYSEISDSINLLEKETTQMVYELCRKYEIFSK